MSNTLKITRKTTQRPVDHLQLHEQGEVTWISFPNLDEESWLLNGFSTRLGGVSKGDCATMNLGFGRGDDPEAVKENFRILGRAMGFDPDKLVLSKQTHTINIMEVGKEEEGAGFLRERDYDDIDGLITNTPGTVLATFYADCVPLVVADPVHKAVGTAHSGWRGTVADMGGELIRRMQECYGTNPEDVIAAIGPSICQDCYEVSEDVIEQFRKAYPEQTWAAIFERNDNDADGVAHYQLNLWEACRQNFLRAGVREENLSVPDLCTCCNPQLLFSHRASHGRRGNLAAFISIK